MGSCVPSSSLWLGADCSRCNRQRRWAQWLPPSVQSQLPLSLAEFNPLSSVSLVLLAEACFLRFLLRTAAMCRYTALADQVLEINDGPQGRSASLLTPTHLLHQCSITRATLYPPQTRQRPHLLCFFSFLPFFFLVSLCRRLLAPPPPSSSLSSNAYDAAGGAAAFAPRPEPSTKVADASMPVQHQQRQGH